MKRRDFIQRSVVASLGVASVPMLFGGIPVHAGTHRSMYSALAAENNNILIMIQLFGGNDGLNSFIPFTDQRYYAARPTLAVPPSQVLKISNPTMGFHPKMTGFRDLFQSGKLAVVQGVGYENANRSHFRSENIWLTGSGAKEVLETGWLGRWLEYAYPSFPVNLPTDPFAVQIGGTLSLMLQSAKGNMGITLTDPDTFFRLGRNQLDEDVPYGTPYGDEYMFIRAIKEQSDIYSQRINEAFDAGRNIASYGKTGLSQQLRLVARLISGGLNSKVFMVYLGGFDTHANQPNVHANLLQMLSDAVTEFVNDVQHQGISKRIVGLTISEFGRRNYENGSMGTDHGAASVQFVFGEPVNSGVLGDDPDFDRTEAGGDLLYTFEYRQLYSELLENWLGVSKDDVTQILGGRFIPLPLIRTTTPVQIPGAISEFELGQNFPNPVTVAGTTTIPFSLNTTSSFELVLYDNAGRLLSQLASGTYEAGRHSVGFATHDLPAGVYFYQLRVDGQRITKRMNITG